MSSREERAAIARDTKNLTPEVMQMTGGASADAVLYTSIARLVPPHQPKSTRVSVRNLDAFEAAQRLWFVSPQANIGVLNLASEISPARGWLGGYEGQEKALCCRSTLEATLKSSFYPLTSLSTIWSPGVVVFRSEIEDGCCNYEEEDRCVVGVVSVAGLRRPTLSADRTDYFFLNDVTTVKNKIRQALRVFATNGISQCVLGALGCGAFANPSRRVAEIFREVILEDEFTGHFSELTFAVLDTMDEDNFEIFREVLDGLAVE